MSGTRKDKKGRVLKKGESQRENYYIYQFYDLKHKRRTIYAKDLPELREKEQKIQRDIDDGIDTYQARTLTLTMAFRRHIKMRIGLSNTTKVFYMDMYERYIEEYMGNRRIVSIKYSDIKKIYIDLMEQRNLKIKSIELIDAIISPVFEMLVRDQIIRTNPVKGILSELKKTVDNQEKKRKALDVREQKAFLEYVENNPVFCFWYPLFAFLLGTGCRIGEAIGLCWKDLDMDARMIDINHALNYKKCETGKYELYIAKPKTAAGVRKIPMMDTIYEILMDCRQDYKKRYEKIEVDGYSGFIFLNRNGKNLTASSVNYAIKKILAEYNQEEEQRAANEDRPPILLPNFSCHSLRHTFCSRLCENEVNIKVIQEIMGHSNIHVTMDIYTEITEEKKKKECMVKLEDIFKK